jgi:hypothetical protein
MMADGALRSVGIFFAFSSAITAAEILWDAGATRGATEAANQQRARP